MAGDIVAVLGVDCASGDTFASETKYCVLDTRPSEVSNVVASYGAVLRRTARVEISPANTMRKVLFFRGRCSYVGQCCVWRDE